MGEISDRSSVNDKTTDRVDFGWNETPGRLILTQADHLSGEELGGFIEALRDAGISGVQVSPSVTKKNRPGQIALIDLGRDGELRRIANLLEGYGITGFHFIETRHFHVPQTLTQSMVTVRRGEQEITRTIEIKGPSRSGSPWVFRIEFDDLMSLSKKIEEEFDLFVSPHELNRRLTPKLGGESGAVLELADSLDVKEFPNTKE